MRGMRRHRGDVWRCEREAAPSRARPDWEPGQVCGVENLASKIFCRECHRVKRPHQFGPGELRGDTLLGTTCPDNVLKHLTYAQLATDEKFCQYVLQVAAQNDDAGGIEGFRQYLLLQQQPEAEIGAQDRGEESEPEHPNLDQLMEATQMMGMVFSRSVMNKVLMQEPHIDKAVDWIFEHLEEVQSWHGLFSSEASAWGGSGGCCAAEEEEQPGFDEMIDRREVQRCGHCGAPTIRNGGCPQMLCTQCNHNWRWEVGASPNARPGSLNLFSDH